MDFTIITAIIICKNNIFTSRQTAEGIECSRSDAPIPYDDISLAGNRITESNRNRAMPDIIPTKGPDTPTSMTAENGSAIASPLNVVTEGASSEHEKSRDGPQATGATAAEPSVQIKNDSSVVYDNKAFDKDFDDSLKLEKY